MAIGRINHIFCNRKISILTYMHCLPLLWLLCETRLLRHKPNDVRSYPCLQTYPPPLVNWLTFSSCIVKVNETMWGRINLFAGGAYYAI